MMKRMMKKFRKSDDVSNIIKPNTCLDMGMIEILSQEQGRKAQEVYLYEGEEGHWYAYERSAELLSNLLRNIVTVRQFVHDTFLVLNRVEIDNISLLAGCSIISCSDTEIVIASPNKEKN